MAVIIRTCKLLAICQSVERCLGFAREASVGRAFGKFQKEPASLRRGDTLQDFDSTDAGQHTERHFVTFELQEKGGSSMTDLR